MADQSTTIAPQNQTDSNMAVTPPAPNQVDSALANQEANEVDVKPQKVRNADEAIKLKHQTLVLMEVSIFITICVFVGNFLLIYLTNNQVKLYQTNLQQIAAAQYNSTDRAYTAVFLESQKQNTDLIKKAFPHDKDFIDFIQTLELIGQESATNSRLELSTYVPVDQGQSYFPFVVSMTADMNNFVQFLKKIEKLAYIVEVRSIEVNQMDASSQLWNYKVSSRVYVSNQFK